MLFFDELDSLAPARGTGADSGAAPAAMMAMSYLSLRGRLEQLRGV